MMAFVQYVRSRVEVIALNVAAGVDPDSVECRQLSEAAAQGITQVAAGVRNLTAGELQEILTVLNSSHPQPDDKEIVRTLCNSKLDEQAVRKHDIKESENYLTQGAWDFSTDSRAQCNQKIMFLAEYFNHLKFDGTEPAGDGLMSRLLI